jgi:threonine synthase
MREGSNPMRRKEPMRTKTSKYFMKCLSCDNKIVDFSSWFQYGQRCPECGSNQADVVYKRPMSDIKKVLFQDDSKKMGLWRYFDFLPVNEEKNIISSGEGNIPIDRWPFLEKYAAETYNIRCKVYAHRHDDNYATGTFKDLAASVVASVLKEINIRTYVASTTGNVGVAYSRYLSAAGVTFYGFIPENASKAQEAEIGCFGQKVFRIKGDYTRAKELAYEFARKYQIPLAAGNFDPMRVEAKKTMVYEWLRLMPEFPTVYIQALSGGTGPIGIAKAHRELQSLSLYKKISRFILVQTDKCSPMADAWENAKANGFPKNWENTFPVYHNPETFIPTLATGYPKTYPVIGTLTRQSKGEIMAFPEMDTVKVARLVAYEKATRIGPAAAIAVGGFLKSLKHGHIKQNDVVMINIGEGIRRAPEFMNELIYTTSQAKSVKNCHPVDRAEFGQQIWRSINKMQKKL